jgi:hypothetical protein
VLPVPAGRHLYKFVIDTDRIVDPADPWFSEVGQNNSCLTGAVLMRRAGFCATATLAPHGWLIAIAKKWLCSR